MGPYTLIRDLRLKLQKLQKKNDSNQKFRVEMLGKKDWEDLERIFHYHYVLELIKTELISHHHNDLLVNYFSIWKT